MQKRLILVLTAIAVLGASGCGLAFRDPRNQGIWQTRIPGDVDYRGIVLNLENPPTIEFVYLLAQRFPESYLIYQLPASQSANASLQPPPYLTAESIQNARTNLSDGSWIKRGYIFGDKLQIRRIHLEKCLVFHQMRMVGFDEMPGFLKDAPAITLRWDRELPTSRTPVRSSLAEKLFLRIPAGLTLGLLWPPPWPKKELTMGESPAVVQTLEARFASGENIKVRQGDGANRGFLCGFAWYLPLAPFVTDGRSSFAFESHNPAKGHSPGGWADCLEQLLADDRIRALASMTDSSAETRQSEFIKAFNTTGMELVPAQDAWNYQTSGRDLHFIPRNPLVNLFVNGRRPFFLGFKFGRMPPNICFFRPPNVPFLFSWEQPAGFHFLQPVLKNNDSLSKSR